MTKANFLTVAIVVVCVVVVFLTSQPSYPLPSPDYFLPAFLAIVIMAFLFSKVSL